MGYIPATEENKYNGWANRESWAFNMWISNDYGLYKIARHFVGGTAVTMLGTMKRMETEQKAKKRFDRYVADLGKKRVKKSLKTDRIVD